jgi:hypothetical protein
MKKISLKDVGDTAWYFFLPQPNIKHVNEAIWDQPVPVLH